jgi:hypothetical protein
MVAVDPTATSATTADPFRHRNDGATDGPSVR